MLQNHRSISKCNTENKKICPVGNLIIAFSFPLFHSVLITLLSVCYWTDVSSYFLWIFSSLFSLCSVRSCCCVIFCSMFKMKYTKKYFKWQKNCLVVVVIIYFWNNEILIQEKELMCFIHSFFFILKSSAIRWVVGIFFFWMNLLILCLFGSYFLIEKFGNWRVNWELINCGKFWCFQLSLIGKSHSIHSFLSKTSEKKTRKI